MKTLTRRLPEKYRSAVRFVCVGAFGTALQYGIYYGFLSLFEHYCPDLSIRISSQITIGYVSLAFTIGFVIEMISNYLLTSFYTFGTHPNIKNIGGFLLGRGVNYVLQLTFLHILIGWTLTEELSGIIAIVLAGVINYFILVPFYHKRKGKSK